MDSFVGIRFGFAEKVDTLVYNVLSTIKILLREELELSVFDFGL